MTIYTSTKPAPYVYRLDHPVTGEFYIGYRKANNTPSDQDLLKYKTSSKHVKPRFEEFNIIILAEFFDATAAYEFEQSEIFNNWHLRPLLLNKTCKHGEINKFVGPDTQSIESNIRRSIAHTGKKKKKHAPKPEVQCPHCNKIGKGNTMIRYHFDNCIILTGIVRPKLSEERKTHLKEINTGKRRGKNKQLTCPHCNKTGGVNGMVQWHFDKCKYRSPQD